ncbi:MAG: proline racemase family protein [Acidimicrobiia bacterium]
MEARRTTGRPPRCQGTAITAAVNATADVRHPDSDDLGFLYGTIITGGVTGATSTNVCVFAGAQVDRSPTGSGVQARLAAEFERGTVQLGELRRFRSIVGSEFTGRVIDTTAVGDATAVIVEVGGRAFYTGEGRFTIEDDDDLGGFLVS